MNNFYLRNVTRSFDLLENRVKLKNFKPVILNIETAFRELQKCTSITSTFENQRKYITFKLFHIYESIIPVGILIIERLWN